MPDTYIVAEIGTAHGGDLSQADELVHAARESGADCAKFQYVIADELVHRRTPEVDLPGGPTPLWERFHALERPPAFYAELETLCRKHDLDFLCTPFGVESARALRDLNVERLKIASPELNHTALLEEVAGYGLPLIVSTGVSLLADIEYALSIAGREGTTILHCITAYPAPEEQYNLRLIRSLARVFGVNVGLSDHSADPNLVPGLAVALGATIVEKHFTLSREGDGLDDPIAMDPTMFTQMCATIRRIDAVRSLDPDEGPQKVVREFEAEYGAERVATVLGDGVKRLAPREAASYATTRRSLLAVRDLAVGHALGDDDLAALRSERLEPGIEPRFARELAGARLARDVPAGGAITWDVLLPR
jgi:sialic acid synthase SpsE